MKNKILCLSLLSSLALSPVYGAEKEKTPAQVSGFKKQFAFGVAKPRTSTVIPPLDDKGTSGTGTSGTGTSGTGTSGTGTSGTGTSGTGTSGTGTSGTGTSGTGTSGTSGTSNTVGNQSPRLSKTLLEDAQKEAAHYKDQHNILMAKHEKAVQVNLEVAAESTASMKKVKTLTDDKAKLEQQVKEIFAHAVSLYRIISGDRDAIASFTELLTKYPITLPDYSTIELDKATKHPVHIAPPFDKTELTNDLATYNKAEEDHTNHTKKISSFHFGLGSIVTDLKSESVTALRKLNPLVGENFQSSYDAQPDATKQQELKDEIEIIENESTKIADLFKEAVSFTSLQDSIKKADALLLKYNELIALKTPKADIDKALSGEIQTVQDEFVNNKFLKTFDASYNLFKTAADKLVTLKIDEDGKHTGGDIVFTGLTNDNATVIGDASFALSQFNLSLAKDIQVLKEIKKLLDKGIEHHDALPKALKAVTDKYPGHDIDQLKAYIKS